VRKEADLIEEWIRWNNREADSSSFCIAFRNVFSDEIKKRIKEKLASQKEIESRIKESPLDDLFLKEECMGCKVLKSYNSLRKSPFLLSKKEARAIVSWLSRDAKEKWHKGGFVQIEPVYNRLNDSLTSPIAPKKWKWLKRIKKKKEALK